MELCGNTWLILLALGLDFVVEVDSGDLHVDLGKKTWHGARAANSC